MTKACKYLAHPELENTQKNMLLCDKSLICFLTANRIAAGLSARERNKLKRKTRALQRSGSAEGSSKRAKTGNEAADAAIEQAEAEEDSQEWLAVAAGQWPFQGICDQMCTDVLDPVWEVDRLSALSYPYTTCFP